MRHHRPLHVLAVFSLVLGLAAGAVPAAAHQRASHTCNGLPATHVGTAAGETILGTPNRDIIAAGGGNDTVFGGGGNDLICGGDGDDTLDGGAGNDLMFGGAGNDNMFGGIGADNMRGELGDDIIGAGPGPDTVFGGPGNDNLNGGANNDVLFGEAGIDRMTGQTGADILRGGPDFDAMFGGPGPDRLFGEDGADIMRGGAGRDVMEGNGDQDRMLGQGGNDLMFGNSGDDLLIGQIGNDVLDAGAGLDEAFGGPGLDQCFFAEAFFSCGGPGYPLGQLPYVASIDLDTQTWYVVAPVSTDLAGSNEVPAGSGDPNGQGAAVITVDSTSRLLCFDLTLLTLQGTIVAAHVHQGGPGENGPIVVNLDWPSNGIAGCVASTDVVLDALVADLSGHYVNVHTDLFPAGAVRGQLGGGPLPAFTYGNPGDDLLMGDWDGDGVPTPATFDDGHITIRNSNTSGFADIEFFFGDPGDVPFGGDWDGDGDDTFGVWRPSEQKVYLSNRLGSSNTVVQPEIEFIFGDPGDSPFGADFDGDGRDTIGVYRDGLFLWRNDLSAGPFATSGIRFGEPGDEPLFGDWDGDGLETPGVYSPIDGFFQLRNSTTPGVENMQIFADGFESGDTSAWR